MTSILTTLGAGSGVDTTALIDSLVTADAATPRATLTKKSADLDARISAMAQIKSAVAAISSSLASRIAQGGLGVQVASSDVGVLGIEQLGSGPAAAFDANVTVDQLAAGQTLTSARLGGVAATVGLGTLTITLGARAATNGGFTFAAGSAAPVTVTVGAADNSLTGLRDAINRAGAGVRASIVSDSDGATLVLKGATGAANAFTITAVPADGDTGLTRFNYRPDAAALVFGGEARDALLHVDGVPVRRASNNVDDLIPGARLRLNTAAPASLVSLAGRRDASASATALSDLADALSVLRSVVAGYRKTAADGGTAGALAGDSGAATLDARLVALLSTPAVAGGLSLRDAGLSIARDGSVRFTQQRFAALPEARAADVVALLSGLTKAATPGSAPPLTALASLADTATTGYASRKSAVARSSTALDTHSATYRAQLVKQFAAMESAVTASKAVGSFLDQQIKVWTQSTR